MLYNIAYILLKRTMNMGNIDELRKLLEVNKCQLAELSTMQEKLTQYTNNNLFIPENLRHSIIECLDELAENEQHLKTMLSEFECTNEIKGIEDAEEELEKIIEKNNYMSVPEELLRVRFSDSRFNQILENLYSETHSAVDSEDYENISIKIAKAFLTDIKNHTNNTLNAIEGIISSKYVALIIPLMQKEVFIDDISDNSDNPSENKHRDEEDSDNALDKTVLSDGSDINNEDVDDAITADIIDTVTESCEENNEDSDTDSQSEHVNTDDEFNFTESDFDISYSVFEAPSKKKFSINECMNLFTHGKYSHNRVPDPFYISVFFALDVFGAFTKDLLKIYSENIRGKKSTDYNPIIEKLIKNRIIRKVSVDEEDEPLYCLTENGKHLFESPKFRQIFFKNLSREYNRAAEHFEINNDDVSASSIFDKLFKDFKDIHEEISLNMFAENFSGARIFCFDGYSECEYLISVLIPINEKSINSYLSKLSGSNCNKLNNVKIFIIGSVDIRSCQFIFNKTKENLSDKLFNAKFIGYSYKDKAYFDLDNESPIDPDDIKKYVQPSESESKPEIDDKAENISELLDNEDLETENGFNELMPENAQTDTNDENYVDLNVTVHKEEQAEQPNENEESTKFDEDTSSENIDESEQTNNTDTGDGNSDVLNVTVHKEEQTELNENEESTKFDEDIFPENTDESEQANDIVAADDKYTDKPVLNVLYDDAKKTAQDMLTANSMYSALAYLKAVSSSDKKIEYLYSLLAFACDDPMVIKVYDSNNILSLIEHVDFGNEFIQSLLFAATMRTAFYNDNKYDHNIKVLESNLPNTDISDIKQFIRECIDFKTQNKNGLDAFCDYRSKEQIAVKEEIKAVCKQAEDCYDSNVLQPFKETVKIKRYRDTVKTVFSREGDIAIYLETVAKNNFDDLEYVQNFVEPFIKGNDIDENKINEDEINRYIDDAWEKCCEDEVIHHSTPLMSSRRNNLKKKIEKCISCMAKWCRLSANIDFKDKGIDPNKKSYLIHLLDEITNSCRNSISSSDNKEHNAGLSCIIFTCKNLISRLDGSFNYSLYNKFFYINFLVTGDVMLTEGSNNNYIPDINNYCYGIDNFTIVDRIIKNFETCKEENITDNEVVPIIDFDAWEYCDIGAMKILLDYYESKSLHDKDCYKALKVIEENKEYNISNCIQLFNKSHSEFIEYLELKKSYGAFDANSDDDIKEVLLRQSEDVYLYSAESQNFGFYERTINCIKQQIKIDSEIQKNKIESSLNELKTSTEILENINDDSILKKAFDKITQYIQNDNFTAAEDLINRILNNDINDVELDELNKDLMDFQKCYHELYMACNDGNSLKSSHRINNLIERYTNAMKDTRSGKNLCASWISNSFDRTKMQHLLSMLGLECDVKSNFDKNNYTHSQMYFDCKLVGKINTVSRYPHVIAPFGSLAHTNSFRTVCLFGKYDDDRLYAEIDKLTAFNKSTIIFVDYAFNEQFRRKLSDKIKHNRYGEIYIVVDRVMFLYFVTHYQKESIIGRFINVAMPYSYYQPYVYDSMSKMPPEMFFGREKELHDIEDRNGIHLLYGGRQLGKSALLKKARMDTESHDGEKAVYIDIKSKNVKKAAETVSYELSSIGFFEENETYDDWESLCRGIKKSIKKNNITYFLLLLDEGDAFIDDCANYKYQPIDEMKHIMDDTEINFKFVIAGLHNLVRYNHMSIAEDSVIPHLKTLTIKPFKYSEAKKLLEVPLGEVGLYFNNDALISTILATTNYFPGLIQLYCSKLVESLQDIDNSIYSVTNVPPYYINEKHIQKILANKDFNYKIKEKFEITLKLDKDDYYQIIALLLAEMYHSGDSNRYAIGYKAEDVYNRGVEYEIKRISDLKFEVFAAYMDELVELNILRKHPDGSYSFLRQNFFQLMGNSDEILDNLQKYIDMD